MLRNKLMGRAGKTFAILAILFAVVVAGCDTTNGPDNPAGPPALTGTVTIPGWITVNASAMATVNVNAEATARIYLWQKSDTENGTYTPVSGGAGASYTPVEADEGK